MDEPTVLSDDLAEHLAAKAPPELATLPPEQWPAQPLTGDGDVNRMIRLLGRAQAEQQQVMAVANEEIARIKAWAEDRLAGPTRTVEWAERQITAWARASWNDPEHGHDFKLPSGVVRVRVPKVSVVIDDPEAATKELLSAERLDLLNLTVKATDLRSAAQAVPMSDDETEGMGTEVVRHHVVLDGALIPGVHFETPTVHSVTITPKK